MNRASLQIAQEYEQPITDIELGRQDTLILRSAHPWRIYGEVAGFIELGIEIDYVVKGCAIFSARTFSYMSLINYSTAEPGRLTCGGLIGRASGIDFPARQSSAGPPSRRPLPSAPSSPKIQTE
jgi:hypothetical protein